MLRVAILGAGEIARAHSDAYEALGAKAQVVAVAGREREKAEELATRFGAEVYTDAKEALQADVDVVDVCLPTFLHEEFVIAAAQQGKHVFCEKPIALSVEAADRMVAAAKEAGVKFMVGQCIRFWPEYVACRQRLAQGDLGEIRTINAARISAAPNWSAGGWILQPELSGGAVVDLHIHDVDFADSLMPVPPQRVMAVGARSRRGALDQVHTLIDYGPDRAACVEASWLVPEGYPFTMALRIVCEHGTIEFTSRGIDVESRAESDNQVVVYKAGGEREVVPIPERKDAYLAEIEYFLDCVAGDVEPSLVTAEDARNSLALVLAARRSALEGRAIDLTKEG